MNCKRLILAAIAAGPLLVASQAHGEKIVNLGKAGNYTILAKTGISTTGAGTKIVGDIAVSPNLAVSFTGFGQVLDASNKFSKSSLVVGKLFAPDYAPPTPANLTTAVTNMMTAYTDAAGRAPGSTNLGGGTLTGLTLVPGVYKWTTAVNIPTDLTLAGGSTGVWIFQISGALNIAANKNVILKGGAQLKNIFWQVAGGVTLGAGAQFKGVILSATTVTMGAGAVLDGKALAQTAVTLISNKVNGQAVASLIDGTFSVNGNPNNICDVGVVSGGDFQASGTVKGVSLASEVVTIAYATPQPTSVSRSSTKLSVKQKTLSTLDVAIAAVHPTGGPLVIDKCSINGSANGPQETAKVTVSCKTDSLLALLSPAQIRSILEAFTGNSKVKFKVNSTGTKGSLSINCTGDATIN